MVGHRLVGVLSSTQSGTRPSSVGRGGVKRAEQAAEFVVHPRRGGPCRTSAETTTATTASVSTRSMAPASSALRVASRPDFSHGPPSRPGFAGLRGLLVRPFESDGGGGLPAAVAVLAPQPASRSGVEDRIVRLRKELSKKGLEAGAEDVHAHLQRNPSLDRVPPVSTIWRALTRRGFVTP
jgi:hypothetical protein